MPRSFANLTASVDKIRSPSVPRCAVCRRNDLRSGRPLSLRTQGCSRRSLTDQGKQSRVAASRHLERAFPVMRKGHLQAIPPRDNVSSRARAYIATAPSGFHRSLEHPRYLTRSLGWRDRGTHIASRVVRWRYWPSYFQGCRKLCAPERMSTLDVYEP